jgi:uncharacterized protein YbjT (DUF2867 family)
MSTLVVGSTGLVGGDIVRKLGRDVVALARGGDAHPKSAALRAAGTAIVDGDLTAPETLQRACEGIETVVLTATTMPTGANGGLQRVDHDGALALIDAAVRQGVKRFVYLSYSGNITEPSPLHRAKRDCEARLLAGPMHVVILRPTFFTEVWLGPHLGVDVGRSSATIYGSGDAGISWVSAFNVADFAVAAVRREYPDKNTILEIGGPEALSPHAAVRVFEEVLGMTFSVTHVPTEAIDGMRRSPDPLQQTIGALTASYATGDEIAGALPLAREYGIALRSVADYARTLAPAGA